jgi:putative membrane protein
MNRMALCSVVVLLGAASCRGPEPPARGPETPPPAPPASAAPAPGARSMQETTPREGTSTLASSSAATATGTQTSTPSSDRPTASPSPATTLTDDQILYALHAANLGEMEQARMAEKKAKNARVKRFAAMMLKDHGEADSKGNDVAKKVRASLTPSESSNRLETDAKHLSAVMSNQNGADFDRSYMNAQVKEHRAVLEMIDRELLPAVTSPDVKELLQTVRPKVEGHLQEAEQILKGLGGG